MIKSFYQLNLSDLSGFIKDHGYKEIHAQTIFKSIYKEFRNDFNSIENIPNELSPLLEKNFSLKLPKKVKVQKSIDDQTVKFLLTLDDGSYIESVLVPFNKKYTICISSQVGCAMNCSFCYTGKQGLTRHLSASEIISQYLLAFNWIKEYFPEKSAPPNIVFMGQGEPLHNFKEVKKALDIFMETPGLDLGPRQITLSTAGYLPGIKEFSKLNNINLALSFHSPFNEERSKLIPLNEKYPIEEIINALKEVPLKKRQFLTFEYLVIKDLNHSKRHSDEIHRLLKDLPVIINLIPFNEFPGCEFKTPDLKEVENLKDRLVASGFHTMTRTTKGDDILAACGQLNSD